MSRERAQARAAREAAAAVRVADEAARRERGAAQRARAERRRLWWRNVRLWQHGPSFRRNRGTWGVLASAVLFVLLAVYLITRSAGATLLAALILVIASPLLVTFVFDRSKK